MVDHLFTYLNYQTSWVDNIYFGVVLKEPVGDFKPGQEFRRAIWDKRDGQLVLVGMDDQYYTFSVKDVNASSK